MYIHKFVYIIIYIIHKFDKMKTIYIFLFAFKKLVKCLFLIKNKNTVLDYEDISIYIFRHRLSQFVYFFFLFTVYIWKCVDIILVFFHFLSADTAIIFID